MTDQIGIIGAGAWGTTLALMLADAERPVTLWGHTAEANGRMAQERVNSRYLPGRPFPPNVRIATEDTYLAEPYRLFVLAVPSAHVRATLRSLGPVLFADADLLSVVKGIEADTSLRMTEVVEQELSGRGIAVLSGPNLAREIADGKPAGSVVASRDAALATEIAAALTSSRFRVYTNPDVVGVELAGALKNVVAVAAGMVDGLGFGDSAKAGLLTRGLAEVTRLGVAAGAHPMTFAGLAGVGDLVATCMSPLSRNRRAGELLASGRPWHDVAHELNGVAEGVDTVRGALRMAERLGVEMPIAEQVEAVVFGGRSPMDGVQELMSREPKDELETLAPGAAAAGADAASRAGVATAESRRYTRLQSGGA
ncbi:MAG: NAD(P)-dependent glycerol-3-phosphate dehydrogenase [Chloroflexota bacterium]|nr:NAD(P)-dependent glycerol-3-phosphate dehydrogenase [Chloroflexota bacterium]